MHFSASTVVLSPSGWEGQLRVLAAAGARAVEFNSEFGPESRAIATFDYTDPYAVERAGEALAEAGLELCSVHGPIRLAGGGRLADSSVTGAVVESLCACIDACAALGGRFVVTQDFGEELTLAERDAGAPHLASREALSRLADYAERHGCVFAVENGAENAEAFSRLVETVEALDHPGLGICLDFGHAQLWNHRDVPRAVREAGRWLRACHVHDNLGMSDDHLVPGDGIIPWAAALEELGRTGYGGPLTLELHSGGARRPGDTTEVADLVTRSVAFLTSVAAGAGAGRGGG